MLGLRRFISDLRVRIRSPQFQVAWGTSKKLCLKAVGGVRRRQAGRENPPVVSLKEHLPIDLLLDAASAAVWAGTFKNLSDGSELYCPFCCGHGIAEGRQDPRRPS